MPPRSRTTPTSPKRRTKPATKPATRGAKPAATAGGAKPRAGRATRTSEPAAEPSPPALLQLTSAPTGRHREIIDAAAALMAEQGYGGASLRELARRVGMSQPSLYHYFRTKEDLAVQILETLAADMIRNASTELPADPTGFPRLLADLVRTLYEGRTHPLYVRAVFAFSRMHPRFGPINRQIFVTSMLERLHAGLRPFAARGELLDEEECVTLLRVLVHAIGLRLMEEKVLFDDRPLGPDVDRYIDYVVALAETRIRALWRPTSAA